MNTGCFVEMLRDNYGDLRANYGERNGIITYIIKQSAGSKIDITDQPDVYLLDFFFSDPGCQLLRLAAESISATTRDGLIDDLDMQMFGDPKLYQFFNILSYLKPYILRSMLVKAG